MKKNEELFSEATAETVDYYAKYWMERGYSLSAIKPRRVLDNNPTVIGRGGKRFSPGGIGRIPSEEVKDEGLDLG